MAALLGVARGSPVFANEVGAPLRRTLFRSRVWRPSLMRAGLLGEVVPVAGGFEAAWTDEAGASRIERHRTSAQAVQHTARFQAGGLRFHDLRRSYATWLVDDGVPPKMVQRVMGYERSSTTLDLYTRRNDNSSRILDALNDPAGRSRTRTTRTTARSSLALRHDPLLQECSTNRASNDERPGWWALCEPLTRPFQWWAIQGLNL